MYLDFLNAVSESPVILYECIFHSFHSFSSKTDTKPEHLNNDRNQVSLREEQKITLPEQPKKWVYKYLNRMA